MTKLITKSDLHEIISNAKDNMAKFSLPLYITGKEVEQKEVVALAVLESVLMHLNNRNLLSNLVSIDYTDPTCDHEQELPLEDKE